MTNEIDIADASDVASESDEYTSDCVSVSELEVDAQFESVYDTFRKSTDTFAQVLIYSGMRDYAVFLVNSVKAYGDADVFRRRIIERDIFYTLRDISMRNEAWKIQQVAYSQMHGFYC